MKFCDIKMAEMQGKPEKAGLKAPDEPVCRRRSAHFHVTRRTRQKKKPDGFKGLGRSIHYALRPFHCRISFFVTCRIHEFNKS
jgi:hypothetical protein